MKSLAVLVVAALSIPSALADTTLISFDELTYSNSYLEDGFRFEGVLSADRNFSNPPALRVYGNNWLTISRIDGGRFSLQSFNVLYRYNPEQPWWIGNELDLGFHLTRTGEFVEGQFPTYLMRNVQRLTIKDPMYSGTRYYVFDDFKLSYATPVPEPTPSLLLLVGLGALCARRRRIIADRKPGLD